MDKQYQVLARKYRPKNFSELLGQTHVSQALANAIDTGRLHHAYLFTGTRGVGKTTIARILAKCLNCETGITSTPCGVCDTCQSIDAGRFLDLIEIDAASRTKVEDTRELLENVPYAPVQGRYKVYLIDEVHMLSTHSFNALLKTLEEPPEHVKFIFATTDPQKLPITIISRCLQFVLRPMPQALLAEHLAKVLQLENIQYSESALWQLSSAAKGSVRDALSLTDQAIAFGGGAIQADTVNEMLGLVNSTDVLAMIDAIYRDDKVAVSAQITLMREKMVDATAVFDELIDRIHQMALLQVLPQSPLDMSEEEQALLTTLSQQISADVLQLYYEILIKSRDGIRLASTPMQALEMGILRLLAFRPLAVGEVIDHTDHSSSLHDGTVQTDQIHAVNAVHTTEESSHTTVEMIQGSDEPVSDGDDDTQIADDSLGESIAFDRDIDADAIEQIIDTRSIDGQVDAVTSDHHDESIKQTQVHSNHEPSKDNQLTDIIDAPNDTAPPTLSDAPSDSSPAQMKADSSSDMMMADMANTVESMVSMPIAAVHEQSHLQPAESISQTNHGLPSTFITKEQMIRRLQPSECVLDGVWDDDKWDYWLIQPQNTEALSADEKALLSLSVIEGRIGEPSQLFIDATSAQAEQSFGSIVEKLSDGLNGLFIKPTLMVPLPENRLNPQQKQILRDQQALIDAQNQLMGSAVFSVLWQSGFIDDQNAPAIGTPKLTLQ
ncbi:DNA polymerase III subunit gamma/tau [uncultured Moraxella sp.]|uniref:DNA polymerase III subunit gamma/tau n=1 Tax=uncultured Moraxella sp. TaxID=263769 RepID=UPI0025DB1ED4|nr:DNA polymerase III subunit gamma/tau [uncultured Moraxella sp.]